MLSFLCVFLLTLAVSALPGAGLVAIMLPEAIAGSNRPTRRKALKRVAAAFGSTVMAALVAGVDADDPNVAMAAAGMVAGGICGAAILHLAIRIVES